MTGRRSLWRIPVSKAAKPEPVALPAEVISTPAIAQSAPRLVYSSETVDYNIWRIKLPVAGAAAGVAQPLISSSYIEKQPQFSPDGKRIAFGSNRSGWEEIWVCDADGSNPVQLTSFLGPPTGAPRWSPDGQQIVFDAFPEGSGDIFVVPAGGGALKRLTNDRHSDAQPSWSHDGRWIYFTSDRSGRREIWKMPASASGAPVRLTKNGAGGNAFESGDGQFVYYMKGRTLFKVSLDGGDEREVLGSIEGGGGYALASDGIYFLTKASRGDETALRFQPFTGGTARLISSFRKPINHLNVSPDGRWLIYTQRDREGADLMLVEGFR
jgi:Tol biopolymer transport system component